MRRFDFNVDPALAAACPAETSLAMFRHMCRVQAFEEGVVAAVAAKAIKVAIYLSSGQEAAAAALAATAARGFLTFTQHRAHDLFLAFGGAPEALRDELLGRPGGTSGGRAGSNCIQLHGDGVAMFGHHGLIGENVPLVVTPTSRSPATTTMSGRGIPRSVTRRPTTFSSGSVDV